MAKAKKTPSAKTTKKSPTPSSTPGFDLAQTAAAAAAMIAHKVTTPLPAAEENKTQSASFRQLKDSLTKPHSQTIGGLLDKAGAASLKKTSSPLGGPAQLRHNQTFGADVNRRSVPRRTGGG